MNLYAILGIAILVAIGIIWLVKNRSKVESAVDRSTTIPSGVVTQMNKVVPGSGTAAQDAAGKVGSAVNSAVDKATKS